MAKLTSTNAPQQQQQAPATTGSSTRQREERNCTLELISRKTGNQIATTYLSYEFSMTIFKCKPNQILAQDMIDKGIPALFDTDRLECKVVDNLKARNEKQALLDSIVDVDTMV